MSCGTFEIKFRLFNITLLIYFFWKTIIADHVNINVSQSLSSINQKIAIFCLKYDLSDASCSRLHNYAEKNSSIDIPEAKFHVNISERDEPNGYTLLTDDSITTETDPFEFITSEEYENTYGGIELIHNRIVNVIIYIHICQCGDWKRSFDMLWEALTESTLYNYATEIRLTILVCSIGYEDVNTAVLVYNATVEDSRFLLDKVKIIHYGYDAEYERSTLLHMRKSSCTDSENAVYLYLHTKGIRHFGTPAESSVVRWINAMLVCNVYKWEKAISLLYELKIDTYGCWFNGRHYAGNFWWASRKHIQ